KRTLRTRLYARSSHHLVLLQPRASFDIGRDELIHGNWLHGFLVEHRLSISALDEWLKRLGVHADLRLQEIRHVINRSGNNRCLSESALDQTRNDSLFSSRVNSQAFIVPFRLAQLQGFLILAFL